MVWRRVGTLVVARPARAQEVFYIMAQQQQGGEAQHIFGVRCKNGHVSYFNKRRACSESRDVAREIGNSADSELDELHLKCDTCGVEVVAYQDCRGYK